MFNFFKDMGKTTFPAPFPSRNPISELVDTARAVGKVAEYVTTDQEEEGRELGIKAAARIYEPVLEKLEIRQVKIIAATDKEQSFFEGQAKSLREQCAKYEQKTAEIAERIKKHSEKKSKSVDNFFSRINSFGMYSAQSVSGIGGDIYNSWSLSNYLEKKMNAKREKFYKIEFEKQSLVWQEKIKSVRAKIGSHVKILAQSGVIDNVEIDDFATLMSKSVATKNIQRRKIISGMYGKEHKEELKTQALLRKLKRE